MKDVLKSTATLVAFGLASSLSAAAAKPLCTIIADAATGKLLIEEGVCDQRITPASTFKVALSLMGYDSGFLIDEHSPALPFHQGYPAWDPSWKTTTNPTTWIKNSVVWYSQRVTESLGEERLRSYVAKFNYGNQDISGNPGKNDGLTQAWLSSSLKIAPLEQAQFLEKLVERRLPVSGKAYEMTNRITAVGRLADGWDVHGKTGTGSPRKADGSADADRAFGWFVGWATKDGRALVFTYLIQDDRHEPTRAGLRARDAFMKKLPSMLDAF
jgi:beta-lactamase class D